MSQRRQRRALIVGGSMSGLLAAIMLARRGWAEDVFERVAGELAGRGAGIVAQTELIAHLTTLGLEVRDLGLAIATRKVFDAAGRSPPLLPARSCSPPGERARHLGAYLQATQSSEERTRSARHGIPEAVLAEIAVLAFLYV